MAASSLSEIIKKNVMNLKKAHTDPNWKRFFSLSLISSPSFTLPLALKFSC